ncbi:2-amino-4-hydroxy-6-hydroxymethyldihydropteridine diphosphokinase [Syntrophorhabdus aromaticivorans]|jgi:2-amino-4-hydroxy-6-hydroxymethyldihydropteridine diphosphokinase|uniref:2-amino-4-hydroxy-6- hydroxymethyldihydropteridine diphosphokinase n=1 Tax=Syntrophorhabdus aromaticivorans TaxID=328301 RepID=UPI00042A7860|nr:2-amino-4-hydroxy-6-hydroxymethyldihydropteridine diphosphokinase [Syntrophorhabdus aromaticivorans]
MKEKRRTAQTIIAADCAPSKAYVGIGSNMGNSRSHTAEAIQRIIKDKRVKLLAVSSLYLTSPVSRVTQNDFINCAISIVWDGLPHELLALLQGIENRMGRIRTVRHGPRTIDLDILLFGDLILSDPALKVPHQELHRRKFAVIPCLEIDPGLIHPVYGKPLRSFLAMISEKQKITKLERVGIDALASESHPASQWDLWE